MMTMSLSEFLLARIAEDEDAAAAAGHEFSYDTPALYPWVSPSADAEHIARHNPARVLAECEARRMLVQTFEGHLDEGDGFAAAAETTLCALASPYADHVDYREEWKP